MAVKGIIFDLGNTLMRFTGDWESLNRAGAAAMAAWYLKKKHIKLDAPALVETFLAERAAGWKRAGETQTEVLARQSLRNALQKIDAPPSTEALLEAALKIFFGPEETAWRSYPDTVDTLKLLKSQGYRLGLYSNATDDALIQRLVNKGGLRPWLSPTFSSAGWGWRKPKREAFDLIANRWGLPAKQMVVVGDTLNADVLGAQNAGMFGILATMDEHRSNDDHRHLRPNALAASLSEVPGIIAGL
ncbi:MAG: HAD family hydrolase [Anaerolineae bacterium]|nr:HAD family hydrolase [Anaerolineae bacterium]